MSQRSLSRALFTTATWSFRLSAASLLILFTCALTRRWDLHVHTMDDPRAHLLLTAAGLLALSWLATLFARTTRIFRRASLIGLTALAFQLLFFLLLVWTPLKAGPTLWRLWWITLVATSTAAHAIVLRTLTDRRVSKLTLTTIIAAVATAALLASLATRHDILGDIPTTLVTLLAITASLSAIGSLVIYLRYRRSHPRHTATWTRRAWTLASQLALLLLGFYAGRVTAPTPGLVDLMPSQLTQLSPEELDRQLNDDLNKLKVLTAGVDTLAAKAHALHADLSAKRKAENRTYYLPAEDDQVKSAFMTYLAYRSALLRTAATYANFASVRDPARRDRCFLLGYAAGSTVMQASLALITGPGADDVVRRKLNEGDPAWGLRANMFDDVYTSATSQRNTDTFAEMSAYFDAHKDAWRESELFPAPAFDFLTSRITSARDQIAAAPLNLPHVRLGQWLSRVKSDWYSPVYATQSMVSTWVGDTKVVDREPCIALSQIDDVAAQLQPGDILLERRNWFFSNAFLPGFWPHAVLYVGSPEDLQRLGLAKRDPAGHWTSDTPALQDRIARYAAMCEDGNPHRVIESVSEGVIFNSLHHSLHADYVAALRPRLTDAQKAAAIAKAFSHEGKPYDFEFDFFSSDKLVCTELVYRAYEGAIHFPLVKIMGRDTLPALEIARKFARERATPSRELDFLFFLDTPLGQSHATLASEEAFLTSTDRPRGFNE